MGFHKKSEISLSCWLDTLYDTVKERELHIDG
jgi:hypothetical protein